MYLGDPIPAEKRYPPDPAAPEWADLQRENLERLGDIVHWWIDHRLKANGQYGGGWDDDCEMWRHWVPVMIAFDDAKITRAQAVFSEALLRQPYMKAGYTSRTYDVEHTAEPSTDTITPMMHLAPDDPAWQARARRLADLMEHAWTGQNERGCLQFKSTYFNAEQRGPESRTRLRRALQRDRRASPLFCSGSGPETSVCGGYSPRGWTPGWRRRRGANRASRQGSCRRRSAGRTERYAARASTGGTRAHHSEPRLYEWPSRGGHAVRRPVAHLAPDRRRQIPRADSLDGRAALSSGSRTVPSPPPLPAPPSGAEAKWDFLAGTLARSTSC